MAVQKLQLVNNFAFNALNDTAGNKFDLVNDTIKVALFLSTSNIALTSTSYTGLTNEVANGNGYTTGGIAIANQVLSLDGNVAEFTSDPVVWTASGAGITTRFYVMYDDTLANKPIIGFANLDATPADVTATAGNTLTITPNAASGWFNAPINNA